MNKVILTGNLACEPETRKTEDGTARCSFRLAVQRDYKNAKTGKRDADFISVTAWRSLAEICGKYLTKGKKVGVVGRISARNYEDSDGTKHYITEVVAEDVEFLSPKQETVTGEYQVGNDELADHEPGMSSAYDYIPGEDKALPF